ncbi:MAG: 3-deoxy-D-manno-octulosonic acid transferase [Xanthomonadales bacterium]|nr:3-deoxy-D-manno-octulosonic acid transferase [Xanthomonadales bacterium]
MRFLYSLLLLLGTPLVLLYLGFRGLKDRAYLQRWDERFGFIKAETVSGGIVLHAASVGEFNAAKPLIMSLLASFPELPLTITTLTPTGSERVKRDLGDRVSHFYIPLDLAGATTRFLNRLQPQLLIVMETEIWPNLYHAAKQRKIPVVIANARLSERSSRRFQRLSGFTRQVLQSVTWIGAQSSEDRERLIQCGANPTSTDLTGNLKFDLSIPAGLNEKGTQIRSAWNAKRPVLVAGSTHEADENVLIPAFVDLLKTVPNALLILVPRHPERFERTAELAKTGGLRTELRSQGESCSEQAQCFVIDAMGELMTYYACGDIAYVGGSMGEQGGHNALEPAALGKPVLFGPNMENAKEIAAGLIESNAAFFVTNQEQLRETAKKLLEDGELRDNMGQAGRSLVEENKGALELTSVAIRKLL